MQELRHERQNLLLYYAHLVVREEGGCGPIRCEGAGETKTALSAEYTIFQIKTPPAGFSGRCDYLAPRSF